MTRAQIRTQIRNLLGDLNTIKFTDVQLDTYIDLSTDYMITLLDFDTATATINTVEGEPNYQFASNQRDIKEIYVTASDGKAYRMDVINQDELNALYGIAWRSDANGRPIIAYRADYNVVGLYPPPDSSNAGRQIRFFYNRNASALASDSDSPIYLPVLHMANAYWSAQQGFLRLREFEAARENERLFNKVFQQAWHKAQTFSEEQWGWRWG